MKFFVIADENTVTGFNLVGLEGEVVETADEAREAMAKAFAPDSEIGIVITTERIASEIRSEMEEYVYSRSFPLVIEIPDRTGPIEGRVSIREMVRSAVGVNV
ncbi:MAG: V-type ATP synthase subunit F [Candidatus Krumholzibacteriota bacterium]|nr:V-type ATP synthase subunit F [Candidatus Krumholzibacteriota bacterium]